MFDLETYKKLVSDSQNAPTASCKGKRLEELCQYLFDHIDGIEVIMKNAKTKNEEIDLVLWNSYKQEVFKTAEQIILVECKNQKMPVTASALKSFSGKLENRKLTFGILVSTNGVTGDSLNGNRRDGAALEIKLALLKGIRIVVINGPEIFELKSMDDFMQLLKRKYFGIYIDLI